MPKLAAFPKAYMDQLCVDGTMTLREWIDLAATLDIDGLEFYTGLLDLQDRTRWAEARKATEDHGMTIPMLCAHPISRIPIRSSAQTRNRQAEVLDRYDRCTSAGTLLPRPLAVSVVLKSAAPTGSKFAAQCIEACCPICRSSTDITLIIENHYKDDFWEYPEFAQKMDVFCDLVDRINVTNFGVNYDPSNTYSGR